VTTSTIDLSGTAPSRTATVAIGGSTFVLRLTWNERTAQWSVDLTLPDGTQIAMGLPVVFRKAMWGWLTAENRPAGELVFVDTTGTGDPPTFDDFNNGRIAACIVEA
jgi:hypothetical protein